MFEISFINLGGSRVKKEFRKIFHRERKVNKKLVGIHQTKYSIPVARYKISNVVRIDDPAICLS